MAHTTDILPDLKHICEHVAMKIVHKSMQSSPNMTLFKLKFIGLGRLFAQCSSAMETTCLSIIWHIFSNDNMLNQLWS